MEDVKALFLKKTLDHLENSKKSLQIPDFRNFASRFYYGYISLLFLLDIKKKGDWHKKNSYEFPSENFEGIWQGLRIWRIRADYEYYQKKSFSLFEEEFKEFLRKGLIEHLEEELKPLLEKSTNMDLSARLLLLKNLEGIVKWLMLML